MPEMFQRKKTACNTKPHTFTNEWPLHEKHRDSGHKTMLNKLTLECIGSKKRFTARYKLVTCRFKISQLKILGMAWFQDHSEMKKHLISKR